MKNYIFKKIIWSLEIALALFIFVAQANHAEAATCTASATGNWNTTGTWSCGHVPLSTDDVVVTSAVATTITVDTAAVANTVTVTNTAVAGTQTVSLDVGANSLTISAGGGLTINGGGATNRNAQVTVSTGTITVPGSVAFNNVRARYISTSTSTLNVGGNFGSGGTLTTSATGTINFNGSVSQTIGTYTTYNNIQINNSSLSGAVSFTGTTTFGGTLLVNVGTLDTGTTTTVVTGATTVNSTLLISATTGAKSFNDLTIATGGVMSFTAAEAITIGTAAGAGGNLVVDGTGAITGTTGVITFQKTGGGTISGTAANITMASATFATNYAISIPFVSSTITVNAGINVTNNSTVTVSTALSGATGTFTQGSGSTLNIDGTSGIGTLDASVSTNTVNYTSTTASQTIKSATYDDLVINKTGRVGTLGGAITVNSDLTVTAGTLADGGFQITGNVSGILTLAASTSLTLGTTATATTFPTGYTALNTSLDTTSTVTYNSNQTTSISNVPTYGNLTLTATAAVTKTALGALMINGNWITGINNTFNNGGFTHTVKGNVTATGSHINTGKILLTGGSAVHNISGVGFNNMELDDINGATMIGNTSNAGFLTVTNGTYTTGAFTLIVSGATTVSSGATLLINSITGAKTFGDITIASGGTMSFTAAEAISFTGSVTVNGTGVISGSTGTLTFSKVGGGALGGTTTSLTIAGATIFTTDQVLPYPLTVNGLTVTGATFTNTSTMTINGTLAGTGTFIQNASTILNTRSITITTMSASAAGNEVHFIGAAGGTINGATYNDVFVEKTTGFILIGAGTVLINGDLTVTSGTMNFGSSTFTVTGTTDIFDTITDSSGGPSGGNNVFVGLVTVNGGGIWAAIPGEVTDFTFRNGFVVNGASFVASTGMYRFTTNNQSVTGTLPITIVNMEVNSIQLTNANISTVTNLTITGTGGSMTSSDFTVNGILDLASDNPTASTGTLHMGANTVTMGGSATTIGIGDVSGIVRRTSFLPAISYTFGNQYTILNFQNTGTLPTEVKFKISFGSAPTWKTDAIQRIYAVIQTGAVASFGTSNLHYRDSELNGNTEDQLVLTRATFPFTPGSGIEFARSNYNTTENWVGRSAIPLQLVPSTFGLAETTLADTDLLASTWNGSVSTDWLNPFNWSPNGIPSDIADIIIPDAAGTPNDPIVPDILLVGRITLESGSIVNATPTSTITVSGGSGAWSDNGGTFNPSVSTVTFTNAAATISGDTDFYDVTINSGAKLTMGTDSAMRISGTITNNGTWAAAQLSNTTVEYKSNLPQTVLYPNGLTPGYYNLTFSGSGAKTLPGTAMNISGNFTLSGSSPVTAIANINIGCDLFINSSATFNAASFAHSVGCNFINNGTFTASTSTFAFNGTASQDISGLFPIAFNNLTTNNAAGFTLTGTNPTINGVLTLTNGNFTTGTNNLYISSSGSVSRTSGHIIGNLRKFIGTGAISKTFEIGDAGDYTPVDISFGSVSGSGDLTMSTTGTDEPDIGSSHIDADMTINRYWTITNSGITFDSYNAVFTFANPGDLDAGVDTSNLAVGRFNGGWFYPSIGTRTSTTTQIINQTGFGNFQLADDPGTTINIFTILGVDGDINETDHTIILVVPFGTDVTTLVPTIIFSGLSMSPDSGVANNFSTPQTYTGTSISDATQAYVVTVMVATAPTPTPTPAPAVGGGGPAGGVGSGPAAEPVGHEASPETPIIPLPIPITVVTPTGETFTVPSATLIRSTGFPDVPEDSAYFAYVEVLRKAGIVHGTLEGNFEPNRSITRAELLKISMNTFGIKVPTTRVTTRPYPDVALNKWYAPYIALGKELELINGYGGTVFKPEAPVSRVEALRIIFNCYSYATGVPIKGGRMDFRDTINGQWYEKYVAFAQGKDVINGYGDGTFGPADPILRSDIAKIIVKAIELSLQKSGMPTGIQQ